MPGGTEGRRKVRGTAAEWESWMGGDGKKGRVGIREGGPSLFSVSKINYFYVCGLLSLYR